MTHHGWTGLSDPFEVGAVAADPDLPWRAAGQARDRASAASEGDPRRVSEGLIPASVAMWSVVPGPAWLTGRDTARIRCRLRAVTAARVPVGIETEEERS